MQMTSGFLLVIIFDALCDGSKNFFTIFATGVPLSGVILEV